MSQYKNLMAFQSGLRNAGSEQRHPQQLDAGNRSLANMPIYPAEKEPTPLLSSFKSAVNSKPRNFSSDLLQQALAAKSNLGLCDGAARSDALQSLRSYGSQSVQDSPSGKGQSVQNPRYQDPLKGQSVSGYQHPAVFPQSEHQGHKEWYSRGMDEKLVENDLLYQKSGGDSNESFTPFRPPLQLNTVEDEDEFLYGDATPLQETPGDTPRKEEVAISKEGTGIWSDEEIMIIEDSAPGKLPSSYESPKPKSNKETMSIPLKDLSWKSSTAWKDETVYNQKVEKPKAANSAKATYRSSNRSESRDSEASTGALEKSASAQLLEKLTPHEKKSKYANAALLLKKQLDANNLLISNSPPPEMSEKMFDQTILEKGLKSTSADEPSKGSQYPHLLINIEQGSNLPKRVVSLTENSSSGKNIKNVNLSPLTVRQDKEIASKPDATSVRVVRETFESTRHQESSKFRPSHYLDDYTKSKPDKYSKELKYERKFTLRDRSPESPDRYSPRSYRYRSPSVERRRRDRSPSAGYRSRHRSRPRYSEEISRERSPRSRHRSRGRSPSYYNEERPKRDKSCDRRMYSKRQHSPDDSPRLAEKQGTLATASKKEMLERQRPVPPSVEETLSVEQPESSRLFPKSMSPDMVALFMKESELPKEPIKPKMPDPVLDSADEEIVVQKLNFTFRQLQQSELLNELVAEEEKKQIDIIAQKVELALDANTRHYETQAASVYPPSNTFSQPPPAMTYSPSAAYLPPVPMHQSQLPQSYPYGYPASAPPTFPSSYPYSQPYPPSPAYNQGPPPAYSQVSPPIPPAPKAASQTPSRWLRSVPVLSAEEMSKSKESDSELMSRYCRRVEEQDLSHKKLKNLSSQVEELKKMKGDFESKSKKMRSGTDGMFISEFQVLQEKAAREHRRELLELKRLDAEVKDLERRIKPSSLTTCKDTMKQVQEEKKPSEIYGCFDTGKHFCLRCSMKFPSIMEMVQHLHTPEHLQQEDPSKSVALKEPPKVEAKVTTLHPVKGLEFIKPVNAFYCSLCEEILVNTLFAEQHLKGHDHTVKYMNFLQENPIYEEKQKLMVHARMSAIAKENRLKDLEDISKAKQLMLKKKRETSEKLQKVQSRLQGEQLKEGTVQELDEMETTNEPLPKKAVIKVNLADNALAEKVKKPEKKKPRQQVIYIGRAPNFRPKEKVVTEKEVKEQDKILKEKEAKEQEKTLKEKLVKDKEMKGEEKDIAKSGTGTSVPYKECGSASSVPKAPVSQTPVSKTASLREETLKEIESTVGKKGASRWDRGHSRKEDAPVDKKKEGASAKVKVFGCQSESESKSVQGHRRHETESKASQKKELITVQFQNYAPKTDDPAVNQALKNIMYGSKSITPGLDSNLSAIKLPDDPPLPPPPDKATVKQKPKPQERKPLTEEEKDFILLGINKSDMEPIAIPRPPPSSLLKVSVSSPTNATKAPISTGPKIAPSNVTVATSHKIALPDITVPPPNLQVPPPNLQVPPPNLQVPPPNLQVPPPTLQVRPPSLQVPPPSLQVPPPSLLVPLPSLQIPPPTLQVPMPNLHVPPPNMLLNTSPAGHAPYGQSYNSHAHFHGTGYPQPNFNHPPEVIDMDLDCEEEAGFEIQVGTPRSNTTFDTPYPIERRPSYSSKPTGLSPNKNVAKAKVPQISKTDNSKPTLTKGNECDRGFETTTESGIGLKEDRLICANVLNSVIETVLEKVLVNTSETLNTKSSTLPSNVNEPEVILNYADLKSPKGVSSDLDPISNFVSTDSTICDDKVQIFAGKTSQMVDTEEISESEGTISSLNVTNVETSDFLPKVMDSQFTKEVSIDKSELNSNSISADINTEILESEKHQESEPPNAKNISIDDRGLNSSSGMDINTQTLESKEHQVLEPLDANNLICDQKGINVSSNQEDLSSMTQHFDVQKTDNPEVSNVKEAIEVNTSQFDIDEKEKTLESKEHEPLYLQTININQLISEENIHSVIASQENPVLFHEKNLSSDEIPITPDGIVTLENNFKEHTNLIKYEEISETPLIHGIEHFMDSKVDDKPHRTFISEEESLNNHPFKQETVISLKEENADKLSISIAEEKYPTEMEDSSVEFSVSDTEKMDVDGTDIPVSTEEDNLQDIFVATKNAQALSTEINLLETCEVERIKVEENMIPPTEEADAQTVSTGPLSNPPNLNYENNSLDSCISGMRNVDEKISGLGLENSEESMIDTNLLISDTKLSSESPEENLEKMEPLEMNSSENLLVLEGQVKTAECPIDIESSSNETKNENTVRKESIVELPLCEVSPLDKEYSGFKTEKTHSTEVENLSERTVPHVRSEDVQENFEKFSIIDIPRDLQEAENATTRHSENFATSDLFSEAVPSPVIEVTEHPFQDMKTTDESIAEDMDSKCISEVNASVPCLEKFDLDDSLSNSLSDNPPVLSEEPIPENICQLTTAKKQDSDTDEYETEDDGQG